MIIIAYSYSTRVYWTVCVDGIFADFVMMMQEVWSSETCLQCPLVED